MKNSFTFFLFTICFCLGVYAYGQNATPIKLSANEHTTTTIFFPSAISKTIAPEAHFKFEYQDEDPSIGLLKARKGNASNLTVITVDGYIFSFALSYSEDIENFNFMLTNDMAVGQIPGGQKQSSSDAPIAKNKDKNGNTDNRSDASPQFSNTPQNDSDTGMVSMAQNDETPMDSERFLVESEASDSESNYSMTGQSKGEGDLYDIDREEYYRIFSENNYLQKTIFRRTFRQNKRILLKLNNILVDRDEIYFVLQVENNSRKEYAVNGMSFFRKSGVGQLQIIMKPLYTYNLQDKIDPQSINEVVFVFKRFKLSNKEEVYIVLDELENNRMVMLPLDNKQINAPTN